MRFMLDWATPGLGIELRTPIVVVMTIVFNAVLVSLIVEPRTPGESREPADYRRKGNP
jgi:hypothetical protein